MRACATESAAVAAQQTPVLTEVPDGVLRLTQRFVQADCHYNLARLYEALGKPQYAIRHLGQYRRLLSGDSR